MTKHQQHSVRRTFILGDSWLYFKLYAGHKTADHVIATCLYPLAERLRKEGLILKWFFIRFHDEAGAHLRFRMEVGDPGQDLGTVIAETNKALKPLIDIGWVWKVQTDTYQRELERYGTLGIIPAENFFFQNSHMIARLIGSFNDDMDEIARWLFALPAIDQIFDAFGATLEYKHSLICITRDNFASEFGMNAMLRKQLDERYTKEEGNIAAAMTGEGLEGPMLQRLQPCLQLLKQYESSNRAIAEDIMEIRQQSSNMESLNNLLASYIHMLVNRLFKSKQRVHEMVIYDFLARYYKSLLHHPEQSTRVQAVAEKL